MFTCSNKVCVEPNRVCDYSDDCGDGTDEALCGMTVGYSWAKIKYNALKNLDRVWCLFKRSKIWVCQGLFLWGPQDSYIEWGTVLYLLFVGLDVKGFTHRCSFEHGMFSWEKSDLKAGWILQKGEQAWPKHGPPRDHTSNTAAGTSSKLCAYTIV